MSRGEIFKASSIDQFGPAAARLMILGLGLALVWSKADSVELPVLRLAIPYLVLIAALWLTASRHPRWLAPLAAVADVAAAGAFNWLAGAATPAWSLVLLAVLAAASGGFLATAVAGVTGVVSAILVPLLAGWTGPEAGWMWPGSMVAAVSAGVALLPSGWMSSAKEQLAWSQAAATEARFKLEQALSRAAQGLATIDEQSIRHSLTEAVHSTLGATCELIDSESAAGSVSLYRAPVAGESSTLAPVPVQELEAVIDDSGHFRAAVPLTHGLSLMVTRPDRALDANERTWLGRLARLGSRALERAAEFQTLRSEADRLFDAWQLSPVAACLRTTAGEIVLANETYREIDFAGAAPAAPVEGSEEVEMTFGDPPRTFMVYSVPVAGGDLVLSVYPEVTREREALRARDDLLSLVGHELRGPLTSIHGFSQMMARNLSVVQQQAAQLDRLIGDLMSKSAADSGQLSLLLQAVDLSEIAAAAVERFRVAHADRQLDFTSRPDVLVKADPARLNQVLDNLLSNAAKYSPADTLIEVGVDRRDREALLWVRDRGAGIASEHLSRLFDRFYRVPDVEGQPAKGLGLGLSVVRDLVTAHGGRVWAESAGLGRGSTFYVSLPLDVSAAGPTAAGAAGMAAPRRQGRSS